MGQVVVFEAPNRVGLADYEEPVLGPHEVRLRTLYSGISAGTELTAYRGSNPYLQKRWDPDRRLFTSEQTSLRYPVTGWGYEEVGEVIEIGDGVAKCSAGDVVWGAWGHRSTHVLAGDVAARHRLAAVDPINGVFSQIGGIALNALLDADIHVGETVAIFGQGVPGLLATQLAKLNGAEVIAVDLVPARLELAERLGADAVIDATRQSPAEVIKAHTRNRGADVSIEFSGSYLALHEAIRATANNSRVVSSGFFQGEGMGLFLGEEFHHNRIEIVCSQISGVSARTDHRWTEERLRTTVMSLQAAGRLDFESLVSHVFSVERAGEAFALLSERPAEAVQVVLRFEQT
jgi:2-desacetyl-2-hydroxyethyl bacteriochlorophyllide A dehydrogenase